MNLRKLIILLIILKSHFSLSENLSSVDNNDFYIKNDTNKIFSFEMSVGRSKLKTNEYIYDDYYRNIEVSKLNWKSSDLKIFKSNLSINLPYDFIMNIGGFTNLNKAKRGILNDYDKIPNYGAIFDKLEDRTGTNIEDIDSDVIEKAISNAHKNMDWNFSSYSNAVLENFYGIHFDIQKLFMKNNKIKLGLGAGYEQDESKWYGLGGYGLYLGKKVYFNDLNKVIEYTNKYKIPYIYLQSIFKFTDNLELSAKFKKSFWASVDNTDYHILKETKYYDKSPNKNGKYHSIDLKLNYKIKDNLSIFGLYNINRFSPHKTNMGIFDISSDSYINDNEHYENKSGIDFKSYSLNFGIKYDF